MQKAADLQGIVQYSTANDLVKTFENIFLQL